MKQQKCYNEKEIKDIFKQIPKIFYKYEPFEFYGGSLVMAQQDKEVMLRDQLY